MQPQEAQPRETQPQELQTLADLSAAAAIPLPCAEKIAEQAVLGAAELEITIDVERGEDYVSCSAEFVCTMGAMKTSYAFLPFGLPTEAELRAFRGAVESRGECGLYLQRKSAAYSVLRVKGGKLLIEVNADEGAIDFHGATVGTKCDLDRVPRARARVISFVDELLAAAGEGGAQ